MASKIIGLDNLQTKTFEPEQQPAAMNLSGIFKERGNGYLNELALFVAHFNAIPNFIHEINIDCRKANLWFAERYKAEIRNFHYSKRYLRNGMGEYSRKPKYDDLFYILYDDLIVDFDTNYSIVRFLFHKTAIEKVENIISGVRKFKERKSRVTPQLLLLVNTANGINTRSFNISKPRLSIDDNYNDDFKEVHHTILKRLSKKNDKGLVLLHGKPGTGKTSYIRYLIASLKKDVIFLPPNMANDITNPSLISVLMENPNSVFVIEDAENIIIDREKNGRSPVSALLNISDGLLSDCLNIQIICSFNTDLSKVDSALMRKGRLIAKYEFKELEAPKANMLSKKLGFNTVIKEPMTLTAIYNQEERDFQQSRKNNVIGFKVAG